MMYGCTKTYFYMSELGKKQLFVYSCSSIILFIVTMFHKLYIFFLKCRLGLFLCKAWGVCRLPGGGYVHCNMALYVRLFIYSWGQKFKSTYELGCG